MALPFSGWLVYLFEFVLGLILGSYLNSWIWRIHEGLWRWGGRSECIHCKRELEWNENIPLVSWLVLSGKCRTCKASIPLDYFFVELFTALLFAGLAYYHLHLSSVNQWLFFRDLFFGALLVVIFVYDWKYQIILPKVVWAGAIAGAFINFRLLLITPYSLLLGILMGGGLFLAQYLVSKGRWIGGGDVRMGVMMGVWLGWPNILVALFVSYVMGALVAIPLLITKKKGLNSEIPFGTFLAVGTMVAVLWGNVVLKWYLEFIKLSLH